MLDDKEYRHTHTLTQRLETMAEREKPNGQIG